jgi:branched-chain amino acid transport system substrate-binding protein
MRFPSARHLVSVLLGVTLAAATAAPAPAADPPFEIPVVLSLTGSAAFLGRSENQSLGLLEKYVNTHGGVRGRQIHFSIADDQSTPATAVELLNADLAKKPPVVMGSAVVALCNAMSAIVKANGPLHYCFSPGIHPVTGSYTFSSSVSTDDLAVVSMNYFRAKGWTKVGIITSTDASGQDAEHAFIEASKRPENRNMQIITREHFNTTDVTVGAQMASIKNAHPDVLVAWSTGTPFGTLLRGISDGGLEMPIMGGNGNLTYPQMAQYKSFAPKTLIFAAPRFLAHEQVAPGPIRTAEDLFYNAFKGTGTNPDISHSFSWDSGLIVIDALRHVGLDATPDQLRQYIEGLHSFAGINGIYDFRDGSQRGLTANTAIILQWDAAKGTWTGMSKPGGQPLK